MAPSPARGLLAPFLEHPESAGIVTDFDGTLAPIVADPAASRPLPGAVEVLHGLAARYRRVAVVSGRPAAFLSAQLELSRNEQDLRGGAEGLVAVGLYGLEMADGDQVTTDPRAAEWRAVIEEVAGLAEEQVPPDVLVERKGLSVTLHYRAVPAEGEWAQWWAAEQCARTGMVVHPGRMSQELRPPLAVDKGTVVAEVAAGLEAVCFLGDDRGDLPAFVALDDMAAGGAHVLKVGVRSLEAPPELLEAADLVLDGPEAVLDLLTELLGAPLPG